MTAEEFLNRAYKLDKRINNKIEVLSSLKALAEKSTSVLHGMPHSPGKNKSPMEATVCKIVDLQNQINEDIDELVDIKSEIISAINQMENMDYQLILEKRYLCYERWNDIAAEMNYSLRWTNKMRDRALTEVEKLLREKGTPEGSVQHKPAL